MLEFEISSIHYKTNIKLNAIQQFMLSKRLVPILDVITKIARDSTALVTADLLMMLADAVSKLNDDDCIYIFDLCLTGMQCQRDGVWGSVWNHSARIPQYADLDLPTLLQLTYAVIMDNLGSFMPAPPAPSAVVQSPV